MDFKRNVYSRKKLKQLSKIYTLIDMHVHTEYSDAHTPVEMIINKCKKLNIGVAITDHNTIQGVIDAYKIKDDVIIIPGIEVTVKEGFHVLLYFYKIGDLVSFYEGSIKPNLNDNPWMATNLSINDLMIQARKYKCLIGAAHPFGIALTGICHHIQKNTIDKSVISRMDFLEAVNGSNFRPANEKAMELTIKLDKPYTCGSDAHTAYEVGKVLTYSSAKGVESFLDSIKNKENFFLGDNVNKFIELFHITNTIEKHLTHPIATLKFLTKKKTQNIKNITPKTQDNIKKGVVASKFREIIKNKLKKIRKGSMRNI